ncbi:hypothetical protein PAXINDRAFT_21587 [Paxillus involutus ATCC 200175]|jgi:hypothetical protein|uniref:Hemagglutinin I domain-containing protein n=1 Tax=Paxillus involutus ATCC 200175 TaxID=664439 RepID=A0A0C9ST52_PAXIN|nr:hypothetical protein PAXINDRAFT_21587 [Paxillus involutus ATCC 200175]
MTWAVFLNNTTVLSTSIPPTAEYRGITRYLFIQGRDLPVILTDEKSKLPQSWAVGVNDGVNPHFQLGYEGGGKIDITLRSVNDVLQYTASSGFGDPVTNDL